MPVQRDDPYAAFNFRVDFPDIGIDGATVSGGFTEVSGLDAETSVIEYRNGNERSLAPRRLPGLVEYSDIVLKRGVVGDATLWQWYQQSLRGQPQRATGRIQLLDEASAEVAMSWIVRNAWPIRFVGPRLNATSSTVAIEELHLAHDGVGLDD